MKRGQKIAIFGTVTLLGFAVLYSQRRREPEFDGRKATEWLEELSYDGDEPTPRPAQAIMAMGTNALPEIMDFLTAQRSIFNDALRTLATKQSFVSFHYRKPSMQQWEALRAFNILGPTASPAVPALIGMLTDENDCGDAFSALKCIGPSVIAPVIEKLQDSNPRCREASVSLLTTFTNETTRIVPVIIPLLKDPAPRVRAAALVGLGALCAQPEQVVPWLVRMLEDPDADVRDSSLYALGCYSVTSPEALATLIARTKDSSSGIRQGAVFRLGQFKGHQKEKVPVLMECLKDENLSVRLNAINALAGIGNDARPAIPNLTALCGDESPIPYSSSTISSVARLAIRWITSTNTSQTNLSSANQRSQR